VFCPFRERSSLLIRANANFIRLETRLVGEILGSLGKKLSGLLLREFGESLEVSEELIHQVDLLNRQRRSMTPM
jgi:hypothetical protein